MVEYLLDHHQISKIDDDRDHVVVDGTRPCVEVEYALEVLRAFHRRVDINGSLLFCFITGFHYAAYNPHCRCHKGTVVAVRGKQTAETRKVDSWLGQNGK